MILSIKTTHTQNMGPTGCWVFSFSWRTMLVPSSAPVCFRFHPSNCCCLGFTTNLCSSLGSGICITDWPTKRCLAFTTTAPLRNTSIWTYTGVFHNLKRDGQEKYLNVNWIQHRHFLFCQNKNVSCVQTLYIFTVGESILCCLLHLIILYCTVYGINSYVI